MYIPFLLKPIILFIVAVCLIRLTGRRSIGQMTIPQTVMIISVGAIIVEPFADKDIRKTVISAAIFIILLLIFEFLSFYIKCFKRWAVGEAIPIIQDGAFVYKNLKKLRLTEDEVMSRMRQEGIPELSYIERGTLEPNGEFGYCLTPQAEPVRIQDMMVLLKDLLPEEKFKKIKRQFEEAPKK